MTALSLRILHVPFGYFPDPVGGTEIYVQKLAKLLTAEGVVNLVAAPGQEDAAYAHAGLSVHRFATSQQLSLRQLYGAGDPLAAAGFARILDDEWPDLVHLHAFTSAVSLLLVREAHLRNIPVAFTYHTPTVSCQRGTLLRWGRDLCAGQLDLRACTACTLHGHGLPRPLSDLLGALPPAFGSALGERSGGPWTALRMSELVSLRHAALRALLAEVDAVVALCGWTRDLLMLNGVPSERIVLSRHGLPAAAGSSPGARRPAAVPLRVAYLGRLDPTKGIDLLVRAVRELPTEIMPQLDIYGVAQAGSEGYVAHLRALIVDSPLITLHQPVGVGQVIALLSGYDLLAVPSQWLETGPLVVLEAFAAGVPVVGSRLGGIAELVTDGVDGLLVKANDQAEWAAALKRLASEPGLLTRLRAGIRPPRRVEAVVADMLGLYGRQTNKVWAATALSSVDGVGREG